MGIPKFFRWLSERYPLVNHMMAESDPPEFDNLYLDMNGIIHHCSHPFEDSTKNVLTEKEMFVSVVHYVDRLLHIVKPRKLLFLAIDGVAPRAKMNQQRQRRFRSARDAAEALKELKEKGQPLPKETPFDSNCITPGTDFMHTLSEHLHFFIRKKLSEDNRWKKIKVVFSGHDVPGEGEHKIMEYIRHNKAQPDYDPNQTHCMYGLDADLIMLALASHEPHFSLLRENVLTKQRRGNKAKITGETKQSELEFHFLHLSMVREYLDVEHSVLQLNFQYDLERIVDDFILMCFFVGNDFLPHSASLDIAEGGLNTMLGLYKTVLPSLGGYLVENAEIQWDRLEKFIAHLGKIERKLLEGVPLGDFFEEKANNDIENEKEYNSSDEGEGAEGANPDPKTPPKSKALEKLILESAAEDDENGDHEWKDLYYKERFEGKLSAEARDGEFLEFHHHLRQTYLEGLAWVMKYYFLGCVSWEWFYPYFYAPLFSDLVKLSSYPIKFTLGTPFTPYQQLLGVLPAASARFLPPAYQTLMTSPTSPISDFYPTDFKIDMTGKKNPWEGIVLVPFIDQARLLAACATVNESTLTQVEKDRNKLGYAHEMVYDGKSHGPWASPAPYLTDIQDCQISAIRHELPPIAPNFIAFRFLPGTKTGLEAPSGTPTLKTSSFTPTYVHGKVNIFGFPSKQDNLILKMPESQYHSVSDPFIQSLLGTRCYVNWPYLVEAVVVGASDSSCKFHSPQHVYNKFDTLKSYNTPVNSPQTPHTPNPNGTNGNISETSSPAPSQPESSTSTVDATNPDAKSPPPTTPPASPLEVKRTPNTNEATNYFKKDAEWYQNKLVLKKGIEVGPIEVMLHVRLLEGIESGDNGDKTKKFSSTETQWPIQLYKPLSCLPPDSRYVEVTSPSLETRYPPTLSILYMGPQYTGSVGNVQTVLPDRTMILSINGITSEPRFGAKIAQQTAETYYQINQVSRRLNISPRNLSKLTGSVYFEPGRFNLGLNIKFSGKNLQVPGYTRKLGEGPWEFSEKAIQLISEYKSKFPRVFDLLDLGEEPFDVKDLLPSVNAKSPFNKSGAPLRTSANQGTASPTPTPATDSIPPTPTTNGASDASTTDNKDPGSPSQANPHQIATTIQAWLKSLPTESIGKVPCGCEAMTSEGIKQVEAYVARLGAPARKKILRNVPAADIVGPREDPIPFTADFAVGDRVVNALDNTPVPFGHRGTIVAVKGDTLDIVFDTDFVGGNTLDGACSDFRGKTVSVNSVYNITRYSFRPHTNPGPSRSPQNRAWQGNNPLTNNNNQSPRNSPHAQQKQSSLPHQAQLQQQRSSPQLQQQRQPSPQLPQQAQQQQQAQAQAQAQAQPQAQQPMPHWQQQLEQQFQQLQLQAQQQQQQQQQQLQQQAPQQPQPQHPHHDNRGRTNSPNETHQHKGKPQKTYKPKAQPGASPPVDQGAQQTQQSDAGLDLAKVYNQVLSEELGSPQQQGVPQSQAQPLAPRQQRAQQRRQAKQQNPTQNPTQHPPQNTAALNLPQPTQVQQQAVSQVPTPQQPQQPQQPSQQPPQQSQYEIQKPTEPKDTLTWQQQQFQPRQKARQPHQNNRGGNPRRGNDAVLAPPMAPALFVPAAYNPGFGQPPFLPAPMLNPNIHPNPNNFGPHAPILVQNNHAQPQPQSQPQHPRRHNSRNQHQGGPHKAHQAPSQQSQVPQHVVPQHVPVSQPLNPVPPTTAPPAPRAPQATSLPINPSLLQPPYQPVLNTSYNAHAPHAVHHPAPHAPRAPHAQRSHAPTEKSDSSAGLTWQQQMMMEGGGRKGGRRGNYESYE